MKAVYTKNFILDTSACDFTGTLSMPAVFSLFGDIASEHGDMLGVGLKDMGNNYFWVTVRTKVKLYSRPEIGSRLEICTWPEVPDRVRANRNYRISCAGETVAEGKTEWTVINIATGKIIGAGEVFPKDLDFCADTVWSEGFSRLRDRFDGDRTAEYTIRSTDLDLGGHMNNALYIRAMYSLFSSAELTAMNISQVEIDYKSQSYEGEVLTFSYLTAEDSSILMKAVRPDGKTAVIIKLN